MKLELKQKKIFAAERRFRFKDKNTLLIIIKSVKMHKEYLIDLVAIDPKLRSHFVFAVKSLISFIIFLNVSLIFSLTSILNFLEPVIYMWATSAAIILTLVSFIIFIAFTRYERIFVSRQSKVPLIYFYNNLPNKKDFQYFVEHLIDVGQKRFDALGLDLQKLRAGELKTLRRILDEGVITTKQYERAKLSLLQMSDK